MGKGKSPDCVMQQTQQTQFTGNRSRRQTALPLILAEKKSQLVKRVAAYTNTLSLPAIPFSCTTGTPNYSILPAVTRIGRILHRAVVPAYSRLLPGLIWGQQLSAVVCQ